MTGTRCTYVHEALRGFIGHAKALSPLLLLHLILWNLCWGVAGRIGLQAKARCSLLLPCHLCLNLSLEALR